jgi:hypothetical protein
VAAFVVIAGTATGARAQTHSAVSVGIAVSTAIPTDPGLATTSFGAGPLLRLKGRGWGPAIGFSWFGTDLKHPGDGADGGLELGRVRFRPFMAGASYTHEHGYRVTTSVSLVAGRAFTRFRAYDPPRLPDGTVPDGWPVHVSVANSSAFRASLSAWYDLNPRFGLMASVNYLLMRPEVTLVGPDRRDSFTWRADTVIVSVGVAYGIF